MLTPLVMKNAPILVDKRAVADDNNPIPVHAVRTVSGSHIRYNFAEPTCRVREADIAPKLPTVPKDTSLAGMYGIELRPDPTGRTFYLPYGWNEVHSVRMPPDPTAGVNATNIRTVITANLSGCCVYVERRLPSNDVIFYHANSVLNSPLALVTATKPRDQTGPALVALNGLYRTASAEYTQLERAAVVLPNVYNGSVAACETLPKVEYNAKIEDLVLGNEHLKEHKGKVVSFAGGTTVAAFFLGGGWQFWFQTYARIEYYFVNQMSKAATSAKKTYKEYRVLECRQFYP